MTLATLAETVGVDQAPIAGYLLITVSRLGQVQSSTLTLLAEYMFASHCCNMCSGTRYGQEAGAITRRCCIPV